MVHDTGRTSTSRRGGPLALALAEIHAIEHQRVVFVVNRRRQRKLLEIIIIVVVIVVGIVITSFIVVNVINITIDTSISRISTSVSNSSDGKVTCIVVDDSIFALIGGRHFTER